MLAFRTFRTWGAHRDDEQGNDGSDLGLRPAPLKRHGTGRGAEMGAGTGISRLIGIPISAHARETTLQSRCRPGLRPEFRPYFVTFAYRLRRGIVGLTSRLCPGLVTPKSHRCSRSVPDSSQFFPGPSTDTDLLQYAPSRCSASRRSAQRPSKPLRRSELRYMLTSRTGSRAPRLWAGSGTHAGQI